MKKLVLLILLALTIGCQREKVNEVGVGYNKSLIIPPSNDLPEPGTQDKDESSIKSSIDNTIVKSIIDQNPLTNCAKSCCYITQFTLGFKKNRLLTQFTW